MQENSPSNFDVFYFKTSDEFPTVPSARHCSYSRVVYDMGKATSSAVQSWVIAKDELKKANQQMRRDLTAMIETCNTFKQAVEIFPKFKELESQFVGSSIMVMNQDVKKRIESYQ